MLLSTLWIPVTLECEFFCVYLSSLWTLHFGIQVLLHMMVTRLTILHIYKYGIFNCGCWFNLTFVGFSVYYTENYQDSYEKTA